MNSICEREIIIDVGANRGGFAVDVAARNPGLSVIAIEPIPNLCGEIAEAARSRGVSNIIILQLAADSVSRSDKLNLAEHDDSGVSSLLNLNEKLIEQDDYWKTRKDLYFDRTIDVSVVRLDSIPEIRQAKRIRFIKIDAQGVDLQVLESLGDCILNVEAGMIEVPSTRETGLYRNEAYDLHSATSRLLALGFSIYAIKPNDNASKEFNLFFHRNEVDWRAVERDLQLSGIHFYDGKHFWHSPADKLMNDIAVGDMQRILDRLEVVESALNREYLETKRLNERVSVLDSALAKEKTEKSRLSDELATRLRGSIQLEPSRKTTIEPNLNAETDKPSEFDIFSLLTSGARILWAGCLPPLSRMDADTRLLDPMRDYRMPPEAHQAYDLVYLVENDLGKVKAWPMVVDEALRLLRPGGVLVVRLTNTNLCSIFALKNLIHQWGGLEPLFEFTCEDGATKFAVRNSRVTARPTAPKGVSFGVITDGKRWDRLTEFIQSVYDLRNPHGQEVEVLVCGPDTIKTKLEGNFPQVKLVRDSGEFSEHGWITRKKNQLVDSARCEFLVIVHDRYTIDPEFLIELQNFGYDFSVAVCRQVRPDGRRFPDWVSVGSEWSWSCPAMLEYGDWTPHMYINGGITIGKKSVLQNVRWNELIFWNQAEDVELTRRLMNQGFIPRLIRKAVAVSHITRPGTMEACEPVPALLDRYCLPSVGQTPQELTSPNLPFAQTIQFRKQLDQAIARQGVFRCEQWLLTDDAIELPCGIYGELGGRLQASIDTEIVIRISLAVPINDVDCIVNDLKIPVQKIGRFAVHITVPAGHFYHTRTFRIHLRSPTEILRIKSITINPVGWFPGMPLPVTRENILALADRTRVITELDGGSLCLSDLPLLLRGARRIAIFVPEALDAWRSLMPFFKEIKTHVRQDAVIFCIGKSWTESAPELLVGIDCLVVDWQRYATQRQYMLDSDKKLSAFKPDLIINTTNPRAPLSDYMIYKSSALGVVGFSNAVDDSSQEHILAKYTILLSDMGKPSEALLQAFNIWSKTVI
jgi:FkbM family methyltransferase